MFHDSDTRELVNLASALDYICHSELLASKLSQAGFVTYFYDFKIVLGVLADLIAESLKA